MRQIVLASALLTLAGAVPSAQTPRPTIAPGNTVLIASYTCAPDQLARADAIIKDNTSGILNKYVGSGKIISWGYLGVHLGGPVNRHLYLWASDPVALMQARQQYLPEIMATPQFMEFVKICGSADVTLSNLITVSAPAK
jgi:hypothetical protein